MAVKTCQTVISESVCIFDATTTHHTGIDGNSTVQVLDLLGNLKLEETFTYDGRGYAHSLDELIPGTYVFQVRQNGSIFTEKLMISR